MPVDAVHGAAAPLSKPALPSSCAGVQPVLPTVQLNEAEPVAFVVSLAVTVTVDVPAVVGVPVIRPVVALIDRPAGRPVALYVSVWPAALSVALTCRLTAVPVGVLWLAGAVTVTVLPVWVPPSSAVLSVSAIGVPQPVTWS